jgi:DNA mismatch repair protein MutS
MNYSKEILVKDYFNIHNHYKNQYGDKILILMQVGAFHEAYSTEKDGIGEEIHKIGEELNIRVTKKNGNKELSNSNPYMLGCPIYTIDDFTESLTNLGYTVVVINQTTEPPNPKREIEGIYSPTTFLNKTDTYSPLKSKNLICIVLDGIKLNTLPQLSIGITSYDMTTGEGSVYETYSKTDDLIYCLDDVVHFMESYPPCEVIFELTDKLKKFIDVNNKICDMSIVNIISYMGLSKEKHNLYTCKNINNLIKNSYQTELFNSVFNNYSNIDNDELVYYHNARLSLAIILEHVKNHQPNILYKLKKPIYYSNNNKLFLGNKSLEQLDIIPMNNKPKSLFDIINYTKSVMGRRFLKDNLANPIINKTDLEYRYELIDTILNKNIMKELGTYMTDICDLMKLNRRIILEKIHPNELYNFYLSYKQIIDVVYCLEKNNISDKFNINKENIILLEQGLNLINNTFDMNYIIELNFNNYKEESYNFIINNKYKHLIELADDIKTGENFMDLMINEIEKIIDGNIKRFMKKNDSNLLTLKYNERDGHYLMITNRRCDVLKKILEEKKYIMVGSKRIDYMDLEFNEMPRSSYTKIFCKEMKNISLNVVELKNNLANEIKNIFYKELKEIYNIYGECFEFFCKKISFIDFINSGALCAYKNGYCKPQIEDYENSFIDVVNLRHPIVEVINNDIEYHPHTISIGKDKCGILLYGINSSGKSTLMKSIGINIIMAQIGYYTSATKFIFNPYENLFTRIMGNDNIFRGMSSFMVEMMELMAILKRNNNKTFVLGDEICRGTEEKSANIIVAYMLETLQKNNTSFITATHLHSIANMESVKKLDRVIPMHLKVEYDNIDEKLIFSRNLEYGQGDKYYGVMVAKYLMKNNNFNIRTKELEEEYDGYKIKQSNYNKDNWMIECHLCKDKNNLETHHINFQKDCNENYVIDKPHIKKNSNANIVNLCRECHDMIDNGKIVINGWLDTSNGRILDYSINENETKKTKFTLDEIEYIYSLKNLNISLSKAKKTIKNNKNFLVSKNTISKIWEN